MVKEGPVNQKEPTLTTKFVQKLYKMYTKIIKNTKFVYFLYTKIVQIKILYDDECKKMYITFLHIYKKCTNCTKLVQSLDQKQLET